MTMPRADVGTKPKLPFSLSRLPQVAATPMKMLSLPMLRRQNSASTSALFALPYAYARMLLPLIPTFTSRTPNRSSQSPSIWQLAADRKARNPVSGAPNRLASKTVASRRRHAAHRRGPTPLSGRIVGGGWKRRPAADYRTGEARDD